MKILFIILAVLVGLYLLTGVLAAAYEDIQGNGFDWKTIFIWLYKIFR